jgi:preprotein translocase subunit SecD
MDNITKTKLINSLIDAVSHFYDLKQKNDNQNQKHIKGFCEGMAYTLVEIKAIKSDEAKRILQGLGKRVEEIEIPEPKEEVLEQEKIKVEKKIVKEVVKIKEKPEEKDDLEVPTIFRKKESTPDSNLT